MQFFAATFEQLTAYRELVRSQQEGVTRFRLPWCVADPQSASADGAVPGKCTVLVVTAEEAEARRLAMTSTPCWMKRRHGCFRQRKWF